MNGLQVSQILLTITLTLTAFLWSLAIVSSATADKRITEKRVTSIRGKERSIFEGMDERKKKKQRSLEERANKSTSIRKKRLMDTIFNELILADVMMRPEEFSALWLAGVFVPSGLMALFSKQLISSVALAIIGAFTPIIILRSKKKKRTKEFETQLADALLIMCNCLRSGLTFQQGMETIGKDMSPPISVEFMRTVNEIRYGETLENSLNGMVKRINSADLLLAVSAVNIQRQTGGNLSEILQTIANTIKERMKIKGEINTLTAQGKLSGTVIGLLPIGLGLVLMVINPEYMKLFFTTSLGKILLIVAAVMETLGFIVIRKVVTIEY